MRGGGLEISGRQEGSLFFIAPCLVAGEVSCCQFQRWTLTLFPPLLSISQSHWFPWVAQVLAIHHGRDRCLNSHQAAAHGDLTRSHRPAAPGWGVRSATRAVQRRPAHTYTIFSMCTHSVAQLSHRRVPGAQKLLPKVLRETREVEVLTGLVPLCWKHITDSVQDVNSLGRT